LFDSILEEYKNKIENLIDVNENAINKIKDLEIKCKIYKDNEKKYDLQLKNCENNTQLLENKIKNYKDKYEFEINEKYKLEEKNKILTNSISNLLYKISNLYEEHDKKFKLDKKIIENFNLFFRSVESSNNEY